MTAITLILLLLQMAVVLLTGVVNNPAATQEMKNQALSMASLAMENVGILTPAPTPIPTPTPVPIKVSYLPTPQFSQPIPQSKTSYYIVLEKNGELCNVIINDPVKATIFDLESLERNEAYQALFQYNGKNIPSLKVYYFYDSCKKYLESPQFVKDELINQIVFWENTFGVDAPITLAFLIFESAPIIPTPIYTPTPTPIPTPIFTPTPTPTPFKSFPKLIIPPLI